MRHRMRLGLALALVASATVAGAEELESGLPVGKFVGAFDVVKCAGPDDGVQIGQQLCYR